MEMPEYRVKRHEDGSVDVWVDGRRIHFPADGKPVVSEEQAPADADRSDPGVSLGARDSALAVWCNGRAVLLRADGTFVVAPDKPQPGPIKWRARLSRTRD